MYFCVYFDKTVFNHLMYSQHLKSNVRDHGDAEEAITHRGSVISSIFESTQIFVLAVQCCSDFLCPSDVFEKIQAFTISTFAEGHLLKAPLPGGCSGCW